MTVLCVHCFCSVGSVVGNFSRHRNTLTHCSPANSLSKSLSRSPNAVGDRAVVKEKPVEGGIVSDRPAQTVGETTKCATTSGDQPSPWPVASPPSTSPLPPKDDKSHPSQSPSKSLLSSSLEKYDRDHQIAVQKETEERVEEFVRLLGGLTEIPSIE